MKGRVVILVAIVLGLAVAGIGAYFGLRKLLAKPPHEVVITYRRHATTADNDSQLADTTTRTLFTKSARLKHVRSEATVDRVRLACSFESKNDAQFEDDLATISNATAQVLRTLPNVIAPPVVAEAEPKTRLRVLASKSLFDQLDAIRGVTVWPACGAPLPDRIRVRLEPQRIDTLGADAVDLVLTVLHQSLKDEVAGQPLDPAKVSGLSVHAAGGYHVRVSDVAAVTKEPRPPPCSAWTPDGKPIVAHVVQLHPKIAAVDRGKFDAVIKDAAATVLTDKDIVEAQFLVAPDVGYEGQRRIASDFAVRAKVTSGLPILGSIMTNEGIGTLIFKREVKVDAVRALVRDNANATWGGIRGARYLQITVQGKDRTALEQQAATIDAKVSSITGVGARIATTPNVRATRVYQIDEHAALLDNVDPDAIRVLTPALKGDGPTDAVVFDVPSLDAVHVRGKAFSAYVTVRTTMSPARLVRIDGTPAIELRWETSDAKALDRVRQAVGESSELTFSDVPASF